MAVNRLVTISSIDLLGPKCNDDGSPVWRFDLLIQSTDLFYPAKTPSSVAYSKS